MRERFISAKMGVVMSPLAKTTALIGIVCVVAACGGRSTSDPAPQAGGTALGSGGDSSTQGGGGTDSSGGSPASGGSGADGVVDWAGCRGDPETQIGITASSGEISALFADGRQEVLISLSEGAEVSLLATGDYAAATIGGELSEVIVWEGSEKVGGASLEAELPFFSRFLSSDGLLIAEDVGFSYFLEGGVFGAQERDHRVLALPDADGVAPAQWDETGSSYVGFVHLQNGTKEAAFLVGEAEAIHYAHGLFLSINEADEVMVRDRSGSTVLFDLGADEGVDALHISDGWAIVTRSGVPILRIELEAVEAIPVFIDDVGTMTGTKMVSSAGAYFVGHDGSDGWPAWRLDASTGLSDIPERDPIWEEELFLLDSQECGRSTQILSDGRLGVGLHDDSRGYFFLEDAAGSSYFSHVGLPVHAPSHLRMVLQANILVMEHESGESTLCPRKEYNGLKTSALVPTPVSTLANGVQMADSSGALLFSLSYPLEFEAGRSNFAVTSDGRCKAVRDERGWRLYGEESSAGLLLSDVDAVVLR
jgi:hypothetical protein